MFKIGGYAWTGKYAKTAVLRPRVPPRELQRLAGRAERQIYANLGLVAQCIALQLPASNPLDNLS